MAAGEPAAHCDRVDAVPRGARGDAVARLERDGLGRPRAGAAVESRGAGAGVGGAALPGGRTCRDGAVAGALACASANAAHALASRTLQTLLKNKVSLIHFVLLQAACPPTWLVAGFAGCVNEPRHGGKMGGWGAQRTPPLAHFVGAPDKAQNMKYVGLWNHDADALAEWTIAAVGELGRAWKREEDEAAARDPFEVGVAARLREGGDRVRAAVGGLDTFRDRCACSYSAVVTAWKR